MGQRPLYEACDFGEALLKMGYPLFASLRGRLIAGALTQPPIHDHPAPPGLARHDGHSGASRSIHLNHTGVPLRYAPSKR